MAHPYQKFRDSSHSRVKQVLKAGGGEVPSMSSPPIQPISPYEQYNVSAGQRKTVGPMKGLKDIWPNLPKEK